MTLNGITNIVQFARNIKIQAQITNDRIVTLANLRKVVGDILMVLHHLKAMIQHIGNLDISRIALSGCGRNNKMTVRIRLYDCGNLAELICIRQGGAAKFNNFQSHGLFNPFTCPFKTDNYSKYYMGL